MIDTSEVFLSLEALVFSFRTDNIAVFSELFVYYIILHYVTLYYIILHYITLYYIILHYITLYHYVTMILDGLCLTLKNIPVPMVGRCRNLGCWRPCAARDHGGSRGAAGSQSAKQGLRRRWKNGDLLWICFFFIHIIYNIYIYVNHRIYIYILWIYRIIKEYAIWCESIWFEMGYLNT